MTDAEKFVDLFRRNWSHPDANLFGDQFRSGGTLQHPGMERPLERNEVIAYAKRLLAAVPDIRLEVLDWAAKERTLFIEWRISATIAGRHAQWEGVDRFHLDGDRAIRGIAYFDSLPLWGLIDSSMLRGHGELLDAIAKRGKANHVSIADVVRDYADAKCCRDADAVIEFVAEDFRLEIVPFGLSIRGLQAARQYYEDLFRAFPDYQGKAEKIVAEGESVAAEWRFQGTMESAFLAQEPTRRCVDIKMASFFSVRNGRIVAEHVYFDRASFEAQAGLVSQSDSNRETGARL